MEIYELLFYITGKNNEQAGYSSQKIILELYLIK